MKRRGSLSTELRLFIRLRWIAGGVILIVANTPVLRELWLSQFNNSRVFTLIGASILLYNALLRLSMFWLRKDHARPWLMGLACASLLLDLVALTLLTVLSGGLNSPLKGFFVFHMVFCSLLLPQLTAFAGAGVALLLFSAGLWVTGQWPTTPHDNTSLLSWEILLVVTVWLTNGITLNLRNQGRRLRKQNRRILAISRDLRKHQSAMVQQEKMAAAGRMAAGVIHEIANPLASMDSVLQLMARNPEKLRTTAVGTLREQVARINDIIRRMGAFAHPGTGQWKTMPVDAIVEKSLGVLQFEPRYKKNVRVEHHFAPELPPVRIVPEAIQQVIINLVMNAVDAMEGTPDPTLKIRTFRSGKFDVIEIADNGHGMTDAVRQKLFDPFFTTKPVGKGTGLGLSIAYNFVREHRGHIHVRSSPDAGATFAIHLPAVEAAAPGIADGALTESRELASATQI